MKNVYELQVRVKQLTDALMHTNAMLVALTELAVRQTAASSTLFPHQLYQFRTVRPPLPAHSINNSSDLLCNVMLMFYKFNLQSDINCDQMTVYKAVNALRSIRQSDQ